MAKLSLFVGSGDLIIVGRGWLLVVAEKMSFKIKELENVIKYKK